MKAITFQQYIIIKIYYERKNERLVISQSSSKD